MYMLFYIHFEGEDVSDYAYKGAATSLLVM